MAEQTSRLAVIIDSSGAQKNTDTLASSLTKLTQAGQKAADGAGKVTKATEDEAKAISDLKKAIDPVGSAIDTLGKHFTQLKNSYGKGLIDQEDFTFLSQKINQTTEELSGVAQAQRDAEKAGKAAEVQQQAQAQAFQRMLDKIDPLSSALRNLDQQQSELSNALSSGKINTTQYDAYTQKLNETRREINGEAQAERDATKAHDAQAASLQRLVAQLDPVGDAFRRLAQQQRQLDDAKSSGLLSPEAYTSLSSSVSTARGELEKTQQQLLKTGQSAKQTAFAMRMIPAQMTDIVVGLSTGQSPFMVLMQQGGQLKDMFGGIGPAIKGVGGYVTGLINPFTLGAAAVGLFGAALYSAEKQASAMNIAANNLNNISGLNLSQMTALAQGASGLGVSYGDAVTSVGLLSQSLSTQADIYPRIIKASSDYSNASGQDLNDVIGMFSQLSDSSGKSIDTLDDKLGFLTVSQRKQADEALRSGNIADAQRIAFDALSGKLEDLTKRLNQGATGWDNFWHSVGRGTSSTWETFKEVVGGDYLDNADVRRYQQRTQQRQQGISLGKWTSDDEQHYQMLNKASSAVHSYIKANEDLTTATKNAAGQSYLKSLISDVNANADAVTKARKAIIALDNQFKSQSSSIQNQGRSDYQARRSQLEQNLSDAQQAADRRNQPPHQRQGKSYSEDAGIRLIDQLNQQHASLTAQLDTSTKIGSSQQALIKWEQQLADIKSKSTLTADQKSLLANQDKITALYQQNAAIEKGRELQDQQQKITAFNNQLLKESAQYANQLNTRLAGAGLGSKEQQRAQELLSLRQQANQKQSDLTDRFNDKSTGMTLETYRRETDMINQDLIRRTGFLKQYYAQADAMEANWQAGVTSSLQNFVDQNSNYMTMASQTTSDILNGLSTSISDNFASILSGTESFKKGMSNLVAELGQEIINTMIKVAVQAMITKAITGIGGSLLSGGAKGASSASSGNSGTAISSIGSSLDLGVKLPGFSTGGYTGSLGAATPAGIVHGQEFVMDAAATRRIGVSNLEAIRKNGLDATLSRSGFGTGAKNVNNSTSQVNHVTVTTPAITIQGNPSDATIQLVQQAARQGAQQGYKMVASDLAAGKGQVHNSLTGGYTTSRRTG